MKSETVSRWLGVGANFGVLLGLFLLWTEISQNKQMTRVELGAGMTDSTQQGWLGATTDTVSEALSVAIYEPEKLTNRQLVVLDAHMRSKMSTAFRIEFLVRTGIFDLEMESAVWSVVRNAMGNEFGRAWYAVNRANLPPGISASIDRHLSDVSANQNRQRLDKIAAELGTLSQ